jgi:sugar lactone lactonase YvrE
MIVRPATGLVRFPTMAITVEQLTGPAGAIPAAPLCDHGEGPAWDAAGGLLYWVDMLAGWLLWLDPATGEVSRRRVGTVAAAVRPRAGGGLVLALERQFALLDPDAGEPRPLPPLWDDPTIRFNDGGCDRRGRFYCGTMSYQDEDRPAVGSLFRLDPDGSTAVVIDGRVGISNGIVWTPDGGTCFYIDSPTLRVDAFDAGPAGTLSGRRPVIEMPDEPAGVVPDGMCLDTEGGLWVAMWGASQVRRYRRDGSLDLVVPVPTRLVTACTFGGPDLTDLYITTSRQQVAPGEEGTAGALYRCRPGFAGVLDTPFAG